MAENQPPEEKKIIVDEDWKSQVEHERDQVAAGQEQNAASREAAELLPPASLATLVSTLLTQVMAALGQLPNPTTGKPEADLHLAKHLIDTLDVLYHKTEGNRTPEETQMFDGLLHQLRLAYVSVTQAPPESDRPSKIQTP